MDLYQLLPLLEGWDREVPWITNVSVSLNEEKELIRFDRSGWLVSANITFIGNKNSTLTIKYFDRQGRPHSFTTSPTSEELLGFVGMSSPFHGTVLLKADDTNQIYTIVYNPTRPLPFYASQSHPFRVLFKALNTSATITLVSGEVILISDKEAFIKSLRRILR